MGRENSARCVGEIVDGLGTYPAGFWLLWGKSGVMDSDEGRWVEGGRDRGS